MVAQQSADSELRIETASLPDAVAGKPYRVRFEARGGRPPYRWSLAVPYLPTGLRLSEKTGTLSGIPAEVDDFSFTLELTDSSSPPQSARRSFLLNVVEPLALLPASLPRAVRGARYRASLSARGGTPPFRWKLDRGGLPAGLQLDSDSGTIAGAPTAVGESRFTLRVTDSGQPPQTDTEDFVIQGVAPLSVEWLKRLQVRDSGIFGSVRVSNGTFDDVDLTVIVVAVNEYGKAFALGYYRFTLKAGTDTRELPFGFSLPNGTYIVHVDAVAEVADKNAIYRARLQQGPLRVE